MSVPNQKTIIIHKTEETPFVMVGIQELREAFQSMATASFALYLYLAGNKDGYPFELSAAAFKNAFGYERASYHRAVDELKKLGYIYEDNGRLNFATSPRIGTRGVIQNWDSDDAKMKQPSSKNETDLSQNCNASVSETNIEIKNKENKEDKEIKIDPKRIASLKAKVTPEGQIKYGRNQGWLNYIVPDFWKKCTDEKVKIVKSKTNLTWEDARIVVEQILDENKFNEKMEMFKRMGF